MHVSFWESEVFDHRVVKDVFSYVTISEAKGL